MKNLTIDDWTNLPLSTKKTYWIEHEKEPNLGLLTHLINQRPDLLNRDTIYDTYNQNKKQDIDAKIKERIDEEVKRTTEKLLKMNLKYKKTIKKLQTQIASVEDLTIDHDREILAIREDYDSEIREMKAEHKQLTTRIEVLEVVTVGMETRIDELQTDKDDIEKRFNEIEQENLSLKKRISNLETKLDHK